MEKDPIFQLADQIRETAYSLHKFLRYGHFEKIDENGLTHRLRKQKLEVNQQFPIKVADEDGTVLGDYFADLLVEKQMIIELKAVKTLVPEHTAQLLGYLRGSRIEHGMFINFGSPKIQLKKLALSTASSIS